MKASQKVGEPSTPVDRIILPVPDNLVNWLLHLACASTGFVERTSYANCQTQGEEECIPQDARVLIRVDGVHYRRYAFITGKVHVQQAYEARGALGLYITLPCTSKWTREVRSGGAFPQPVASTRREERGDAPGVASVQSNFHIPRRRPNIAHRGHRGHRGGAGL